MAITPESFSHNAVIEFRAPPPSPVASGRRSSVTNDDILTEFLEKSLTVPDLVLPDRVFPRQKSLQDPPTLDFLSLTLPKTDSSASAILDSIARIGCFEVVNHGVSLYLCQSVLTASAGIYGIPPEKRSAVTRSPEMPFGFEEAHGEDESDVIQDQEFVWCGGEELKSKMEGILPGEYSNFSLKMQTLAASIEEVAAKILEFLKQSSPRKLNAGFIDEEGNHQITGPICYIQKHCRNMNGSRSGSSVRYDVIRMLVRGSEFPHWLCVHVCNEAEEFHVYSKKGWVSFEPAKDSLIVTVGDKLQSWSGGRYKQVIGRSIFKCRNDEDSISMAFLFSSASSEVNDGVISRSENSVSVIQQVIIAIILTLLSQLLFYFYDKLVRS